MATQTKKKSSARAARKPAGASARKPARRRPKVVSTLKRTESAVAAKIRALTKKLERAVREAKALASRKK